MSAQDPVDVGRSGPRAAVAGALTAAIALGAAELLAGLLDAGSSLVVAVGDLVIDFAPPLLEDTGIALFGTNDKLALIVGTVILSLLFGAVLGRVAARRFWAAVAGLAAFGAVGVWAASRSPMMKTPTAVVVSLGAVAAGVAALWLLIRRATPADADDPAAITSSRRAFLGASAGALAVAAASAAGGRCLLQRSRRVLAAGREEVILPAADEPAAPAPPAASIAVAGISPVITPNDDFYRIDTALVVPRVDPRDWELRIMGMVERPYRLNLTELLAMPMIERYVTLACVSNRVGGDLVGNALWRGVPLAHILERARPEPAATQIVGRSVDDFTVGFPTAVALDGREAMVAVGMNGEPLPFNHGFPARLVVAGLYGYVSATKWLAEIELTTLEGFDAYWVPRGWAKEAPIKTQARIDLPSRRTLQAGPQPVAGVAWAPNRGISRVEVRIDDGEWREAQLAAPLSSDSWVQWIYEWQAEPGDHFIEVRATDGDGVTQTAELSAPRPDGATGYHLVRVEVVAA